MTLKDFQEVEELHAKIYGNSTLPTKAEMAKYVLLGDVQAVCVMLRDFLEEHPDAGKYMHLEGEMKVLQWKGRQGLRVNGMP